VTYQNRWKAYVARLKQEFGFIDPSPPEIADLEAGDEHLFELEQQRLRKVSKRTP
jgi:hypothetical protein